ncbi:MAG TPA: NADH-quinone oxidoreductase subunit J [Ohtaekwangia sp.]
MNAAEIILYVFECVAALAAISLIFVRNVFYGALLMVICLLAIAGLYVLMFAEFIAVTQILVYAGGILVVIIFGIMLTSRISGKPLVVEHTRIFEGIICGVVFFGLLAYAFTTHQFDSGIFADGLTGQNIQSIGVLIMTDYALPFEITGILLLIALIGSAVVASVSKSKQG